MRKFATLICTVLLVTTSTSAVLAQEVKDVPPGDDKIVPLREGEKAPYSGQLFDPATALRWSNWLLQYKLRLQIDAEYNKKVYEADKKLWEQKLEIEQEKYKTVTLDYQKQVAGLSAQVNNLDHELRNPPWYKTVWFGVALGVVFTGTAVGLGVYAAK